MPIKQSVAHLGEVDIAYFDTGIGTERPVILLIHGFASSARVNWIGTGWTETLSKAGYRVVALDNRGHGGSSKFYSPQDYGPDIFASDALALLDFLDIKKCNVMGYSMGARITCWMSHQEPQRINSAIYGGMGSNIFGGRGGYEAIARALETDDPRSIGDATALAFRQFADATGSDRKALAACIRPSRNRITPEMVRSILTPTLVAVGSQDDIGGSPIELADMMANAEGFVIDGTDHMRATGAPAYKRKALEFLQQFR